MPNDNPRRFKIAALTSAAFVAALWAIHALDGALALDLFRYGVYPGRLSGLVGIAAAPLIHGSLEHLVANSLPMLLLGTALLYAYPRSRWWVLCVIWAGSGLGVWLFARPSYHIGASGLAHGLMFFLLVAGILRRDPRSAALAMLAFFLYGSMVYGIFPRIPAVSFEAHLFGALAGVVAAVIFRSWDPGPPRKVYEWEVETADEATGAATDAGPAERQE